MKTQKHATENIQVGSPVPGFGARGCLSAYLCGGPRFNSSPVREEEDHNAEGHMKRKEEVAAVAVAAARLGLKRKVEESKRGWQ